MKSLSISLCLFVALLSIYWYKYTSVVLEFQQVDTTAYSDLDDATYSKIDKLKECAYDPRRYPVSLLNHLQSFKNDKSVSLCWSDVIDTNNKTDLGKFWMYQFPVNQICLMKDQTILYQPTVNSPIELVDVSLSINKTVIEFFQNLPKTHPYSHETIHLSTSDFLLNFTTQVQNLPQFQRDTLLAQTEAEEYRYFKEGSLLSPNAGNGLAHYDLRFYHSRIKPIDRVAILHRIVRAWARFTNSQKITTWLGHGSLMGYYFNGLILPWDDDLDVQVSARSFWDLVKLNGTLVIDYEDNVNLGKYLIDVNPFFYKRERNSDNKIDARFIDIESGLYIDITVLTNAINDQSLFELLDEYETREFYKLFDPYYGMIVTDTYNYQEEVHHKANLTMSKQSLISCKDYHFYTAEEISPLIPTPFEGEILYVPNNIEVLLLREYGRKSLYLMQFKNFVFDRMLNIWKSKEVEYEFNDKLSEFTKFHYDQIRQTTHMKRHVFEDGDLRRFSSFRAEPWIREELL